MPGLLHDTHEQQRSQPDITLAAPTRFASRNDHSRYTTNIIDLENISGFILPAIFLAGNTPTG